jgi:carbon storage regulator
LRISRRDHADRLLGAIRAAQTAGHFQLGNTQESICSTCDTVLCDFDHFFVRNERVSLPTLLPRFAILPGLTRFEFFAFRRKKCHTQYDIQTRYSSTSFQGGISMLALTRKIGESIIIDGCITVTIVAVNGNKVRIGISAPPEITIDRQEVHVRRQEFATMELVGIED